MFAGAISYETKGVLEKIASSELAESFYLAGGTGLAVQLGHRVSIDLDWFSATAFSNGRLKKTLSGLGNFELTTDEEGTISGILNGVKVSFFHYDYEMLFPFFDFNGIKLADEKDIAAMKIAAISSRGSKKDFIDAYFLLKKYSLVELLGLFERKYSDAKYNMLHIVKSLTYFEEAESEPLPVMLQTIEWSEVKRIISSEANKIPGN